MTSDVRDGGPHRINLSWLVRLRWGAIAGQLCTIAVAVWAMDMALPLPALLGLVGLEALINIACHLRLGSARPVDVRLLAAVMGIDMLILTGLLLLSGGAYNPFSFLYLVNIALGAVVLPGRWTWALTVLAAAGSGLLFSGVAWGPAPSEGDSHAEHMQTHLQGMWIAFLVAAAFIVYFVSRVRRALGDREQELAAERSAAARNERLTSLATLAAGAAHELATPLSTIAVVAKELDRHIRQRPEDVQAMDDVAIIRAQVDRCRTILDQMSADAGTSRADAPRRFEVRELLTATLAPLADSARVQVDIDPQAAGLSFEGPLRAVAQALRGVVKNALEADGDAPGVQKPITLSARPSPFGLCLEVVDQGIGMASETLARAGEPFFTTKVAGQGMGLGLFLARTVFERLGGDVRLESHPGAGTRAIVRLPVSPVAPSPARSLSKEAPRL